MKLKKTFKSIIAFMALWFTIETLVTISFGISIPSTSFKPEYIVVFGNKVNTDGTLSNRLEARLNEALIQYRHHKSIIFVSGGLGKEGYYEGDKMKDFLNENGISLNQIIVDNNGNTTMATIENFKLHVGTEKKVLFVSQHYHLRRIALCANKLGYKNFETSAPKFYQFRDCYALFREFFAINKYRFIL